MKQIGKRLGVHMPVLYRHLQNPRVGIFKMGIQPFASPAAVLFYLLARRPIAGRIRGGCAWLGIDAAREKVVEPRTRRSADSRRGQQVPVESFEVAQVKNEPVPVCNRTIVNRLGSDQLKQGVCLAPGVEQLPAKCQYIQGANRRNWHGNNDPGISGRCRTIRKCEYERGHFGNRTIATIRKQR